MIRFQSTIVEIEPNVTRDKGMPFVRCKLATGHFLNFIEGDALENLHKTLREAGNFPMPYKNWTSFLNTLKLSHVPLWFTFEWKEFRENETYSYVRLDRSQS